MTTKAYKVSGESTGEEVDATGTRAEADRDLAFARIDEIASALKEQADLPAIARVDQDELDKTLSVVLRSLPRRSGNDRWDEAIGPFYSWSAVSKILGDVTRPTVDNHRNAHEILGVKSQDNRWLYPSFQWMKVDKQLRPLPMLSDVLEVLEPELHDEGLHAAWWLVTPNRRLGGTRPVDWMRQERSLRRLLKAAQAERDSLDPALTP